MLEKKNLFVQLKVFFASLNCYSYSTHILTSYSFPGTLLSEMSYSRSEDDLDLSLASTRRSWVQRGGWTARENPPANKKRRSSTSSATKVNIKLN